MQLMNNERQNAQSRTSEVRRRDVLKATVATGSAIAACPLVSAPQTQPAPDLPTPSPIPVVLRINGSERA